MNMIQFTMTTATASLLILQWYSYLCTACTWALKLLPKPDDVKAIFESDAAPHRYIIFWNLIRWISGNSSWVDRSGAKLKATETAVSTDGTVVTTKVEQEIKGPKP